MVGPGPDRHAGVPAHRHHDLAVRSRVTGSVIVDLARTQRVAERITQPDRLARPERLPVAVRVRQADSVAHREAHGVTDGAANSDALADEVTRPDREAEGAR